MSYDVTKAFTGLNVISVITGPDAEASIQEATFVLLGNRDEVLIEAFKATNPDRKPEACLENLKAQLRREIEDLFRLGKAQEEAEQRAKQAEVREELKASQQPHELGTVNEIAARFGISKSEVRRRKAEGTLHELIKG